MRTAPAPETDSYGSPAGETADEYGLAAGQDNTVDVYGSALAPVGTSAPGTN